METPPEYPPDYTPGDHSVRRRYPLDGTLYIRDGTGEVSRVEVIIQDLEKRPVRGWDLLITTFEDNPRIIRQADPL